MKKNWLTILILLSLLPIATAQPEDITPPAMPTNLTVTTVSSSQINLSWTASTDNVGVTGYKMFRNGTQITTVTSTSYQNTGLSPATTYSYTVQAYDAAGNNSGQSNQVSATTQPSSGQPQCSDGIDNDGDGLVDWQYDLGCYGPNDEEIAQPRDQENGWTTFDKSADTKIVYVSNNDGSDVCNGLSPTPYSGSNPTTCPKKTIGAGYALMRDGFPDWLLLKRGDVWTESLGYWSKWGPAADKKQVIATYGNSTERPKLLTGTNSGLNLWSSMANNLAVLGLHFESTSDGSSGNVGIRSYSAGRDVLLEDLFIKGYKDNILIHPNGHYNYELRRSVIVDAFSTNSHSQGIYAYHNFNLLIEENVFVHNGWKEGVASSTIFNRNMYLSGGTATVRGNIDALGASGGVQSRMGGVTEDNLYLRNPISITYGHNENEPKPVEGIIRNNVILGGRDIDTQCQGNGITITSSASVIENLSVYNNIIAHQKLGTCNIRGIMLSGSGHTNVDIHHNIFYDWRNPSTDPNFVEEPFSDYAVSENNVSIRDNDFQQPIDGFVGFSQNGAGVKFFGNRYHSGNPENRWFRIGSSVLSFSQWVNQTGDTSVKQQVQYPDPNRDIESYAATLGITPTLEAFLAEARKQSRFNWKQEYTAYAVNDYIRAGFGIGTTPINQPPTVSAGSDLTVTLPTSASLNGTVTDDGLPNPPARVTTTWTKVSGPGAVTFANAGAVDTTASFSVAGSYLLRLTASDGELMRQDDVNVTINNIASDTTPPAMPTNLTATTVSSSQINLSWTASTDNAGVTGYKIYRNSTQIATASATSYQDTGLTPNTTYFYTVSAFDAAGNNSTQTTSASATTQPQCITLPILMDYISQWKNGALTMITLIQKIQEWKTGTGC